eukprot:s221_g32.t1
MSPGSQEAIDLLVLCQDEARNVVHLHAGECLQRDLTARSPLPGTVLWLITSLLTTEKNNALHLDDFAESFLMSAFRNGSLRTMKANYAVAAKDLRVCRPLVNVREKTLANFAKENRLPVISDNCPACFAAPKERHRIKIMLSQQESLLVAELLHEAPDDWWRQLMADEDDEDGAAPALTQVASPPSPITKPPGSPGDDRMRLALVAVSSAIVGGLVVALARRR